jgi:NADH:ubiquinone oxidoreductase subunit C
MTPITNLIGLESNLLVYKPVDELIELESALELEFDPELEVEIEIEPETDMELNTTYMIYDRQGIQSLAAFLKLHSLTRAVNAIEATVIDRLNKELRFNVIYHIQSTTTNSRYVLVTWASETNPLISLQGIYPAFNW